MVGPTILSSEKDKLLPDNTLVISNHVLGIKIFFFNTRSMFNKIICFFLQWSVDFYKNASYTPFIDTRCFQTTFQKTRLYAFRNIDQRTHNSLTFMGNVKSTNRIRINWNSQKEFGMTLNDINEWRDIPFEFLLKY